MRTLLVVALSLAIAPNGNVLAQRRAAPDKAAGLSTASLVRSAIENIARVIEIYSASGSLRKARPSIRAVERSTDLLKAQLADTDLLESLQDARYSFVRAESFFKAKTERQKLSTGERNLLTEMAWRYKCSTENRDGLTVGFDADRCIRAAMEEAKTNQQAAFKIAAASGFYSPR